MESDNVPNVLADRYASPAMKAVWSTRGRVVLEREYWIAVMKAQRDLGLDIPTAALAAYEKVKDQVDFESIRKREEETRHDVKARIDEFCALAGHQHVHKGLTSRDLTESVEQLQVFRSLQLVRAKGVAALAALARRAQADRDVLIAARTHNVAAQPTTVGKRWAMFGEECLRGIAQVDAVLEAFAARGLNLNSFFSFARCSFQSKVFAIVERGRCAKQEVFHVRELVQHRRDAGKPGMKQFDGR